MASDPALPQIDAERDPHAERPDWSARRAAIVALALMLGYFAIDNHVPVYPWNNLASAGSQWPSTLAGWIPGLFTIWALARGSRWGITFGAGWSAIWLLLQVRQWWLPYVFGPTPLHHDFGWYWEGGYAQTLYILPASALRPVPNVEHLVLQFLSLGSFGRQFSIWSRSAARRHDDSQRVRPLGKDW